MAGGRSVRDCRQAELDGERLHDRRIELRARALAGNGSRAATQESNLAAAPPVQEREAATETLTPRMRAALELAGELAVKNRSLHRGV